jgi:hypothetical protein
LNALANYAHHILQTFSLHVAKLYIGLASILLGM